MFSGGRSLGRSRAGLIVFGILSSAVIAYFAIRGVRLRAAWDALRETDYRWVAPSLALLVVAFFVRGIRWWCLFRPEQRPALASVIRALFVGYLANNLLPARAGEAARTLVLNRLARTPIAETAATVLVERLFDVVSLLLLLFLMLPWLPAVSWLRGAAIFGGALIASTVLLVAIVRRWRERPLRFLFRPLTRLPLVPADYVDRGPQEFVSGLAGLLRPTVGLVAFLWTTLSWLLIGLAYWILMLGFDFQLSPLAGLLVVIGIGLALILPSSPGAIGVFEAATVVVLGAYGIDRSRSLSYALVLHAVNVLPFVVVAFVAINRRWFLQAKSSRARDSQVSS
jgi:uncharacterized protein (TIRG00374 family)